MEGLDFEALDGPMEGLDFEIEGWQVGSPKRPLEDSVDERACDRESAAIDEELANLAAQAGLTIGPLNSDEVYLSAVRSYKPVARVRSPPLTTGSFCAGPGQGRFTD